MFYFAGTFQFKGPNANVELYLSSHHPPGIENPNPVAISYSATEAKSLICFICSTPSILLPHKARQKSTQSNKGRRSIRVCQSKNCTCCHLQPLLLLPHPPSPAALRTFVAPAAVDCVPTAVRSRCFLSTFYSKSNFVACRKRPLLGPHQPKQRLSTLCCINFRCSLTKIFPIFLV